MKDNELFEFIDVADMLNELGIRNVRDTHNGEVQFSCPFPGHSHLDSRPSASMTTVERPNKDGGYYPKTSYNCFTCGMRGTAITFLAEYEGVSPITAKRWLRERFAKDVVLSRGNLVDQINDILNVPETKGRTPLRLLSESEVEDRGVDWIAAYMEWIQTKNSPEPFNYMFDRGFEPETLLDFQVGYDEISGRFSIPIRDADGNLVGFKGRAWWPEAQAKYLALGGDEYNFETYSVSRVLFGLEKAKQFMPTDPLIVREGELNVMAIHQAGHYNCVGISGCNLSETQIGLIKAYSDKAIIWFDKYSDSGKAARKLNSYMPVLICEETDKDPADLMREGRTQEIRRIISDAKSSIQMSILGVC